MKRVFDLMISIAGLTMSSVVLIPAMIAIWLGDFHSPLFIAERVGRREVPFRMVKLRSMRILSAKEKVLSTAADDPRITYVGKLVRVLKLDELTQLWNVLRGEMSLVGPRPQVLRDAARYTEEEKELFSMRPGITDLASIVFADEGEILRGASEPDARYDAVIRPWKSRLALVYVRRHPPLLTDLRIIWLTILNAVNRQYALDRVSCLVGKLGGDEELERVAMRRNSLRPALPPGADPLSKLPTTTTRPAGALLGNRGYADRLNGHAR